MIHNGNMQHVIAYNEYKNLVSKNNYILFNVSKTGVHSKNSSLQMSRTNTRPVTGEKKRFKSGIKTSINFKNTTSSFMPSEISQQMMNTVNLKSNL